MKLSTLLCKSVFLKFLVEQRSKIFGVVDKINLK